MRHCASFWCCGRIMGAWAFPSVTKAYSVTASVFLGHLLGNDPSRHLVCHVFFEVSVFSRRWLWYRHLSRVLFRDPLPASGRSLWSKGCSAFHFFHYECWLDLLVVTTGAHYHIAYLFGLAVHRGLFTGRTLTARSLYIGWAFAFCHAPCSDDDTYLLLSDHVKR